jgi:hypothetical protein
MKIRIGEVTFGAYLGPPQVPGGAGKAAGEDTPHFVYHFAPLPRLEREWMRRLAWMMIALGLLATACERKTTDFLNIPVISEVDAEPAMIAAQNRARAQKNAKLSVLIRSVAEGKPFTINAEGVADFAHKRTQYNLNLGIEFIPKHHFISIIFTPNKLYIGLPQESKGVLTGGPKKWAAMNRAFAAAVLSQVSGGGAQIDPADGFLPLRGIRPGVDFVRTEDIDGVRTSEFYAQIDPNEAVRRVSGKEKDSVRTQLAGVGEIIPAAAWLDATGLTYRFAVTLGVGQQSSRIVTTLSNYGSAGSVSLPPDSKVVEVTSPDQLQQVLGGGPPQPQPVPQASGSFSGTATATVTPAPSGSGSPTPTATSATFTPAP